MRCAVFLRGSDVPVWVAMWPTDLVINMQSAAASIFLFEITAFDLEEDEDGDVEYREYVAYIRAADVAFVRPLARATERRIEAAVEDS